MKKDSIEITGIMLRRSGAESDPLAHAVVEVEINGKWVEVMRELIGSNFSHIVNPAGIRRETP